MVAGDKVTQQLLAEREPGPFKDGTNFFYRNPQMFKGGTFVDMEGDRAMSTDSVDLPGTPDSDIVEDKVVTMHLILFFLL